MTSGWIAYDYNDEPEMFDSYEEALVEADLRIKSYLVDGVWNEDVESVIIAHVVSSAAIVMKRQPDDPDWDQEQADADGVEYYCTYEMFDA